MNEIINNNDRLRRIEYQLINTLRPENLVVHDDSAQHAGHAGAASGAGHFSVDITSPTFEGKTPIERHRMVYDALADLLETEIHALRIDAKTPTEVSGSI